MNNSNHEKAIQDAIAKFEEYCEQNTEPSLEKFIVLHKFSATVADEIRQHVSREKQLEEFLQGNELQGLSKGISSESELAIGVSIGNYKLVEKIAEGGMGSVWEAEQLSPVSRKVALKLVKSTLNIDEAILRFDAERQALAMMKHNNIAKIFDAGVTAEGRPYFVMEFIEGVPITQFADEQKLTIRQRLELFVQICSAVQHAHQKGVIHRDLKPSNVLVTTEDGLAVPKVIDFGLAKALDQKNRLSTETISGQFGAIVGTLQYMSPEQADFDSSDIDSRTDIYSLGVMLYELLTGTTPIEKERSRETCSQKLWT